MRVIQISDPHLLPDGSPYQRLDNSGRWASALQAAVDLSADYLLLTGDFCAELPQVATYQKLKIQLDQLGIPYQLLAGNHDSREMLREVFDLTGGTDAPICYQHELGDRQLLVLDSSPAEVDKQQLSWLAAALQSCERPMVAIHHPPCPLGAKFMDAKYPLNNYQPLLDILHAYEQPLNIFCGHYHYGQQLQAGNLHIYCCPPTSFFIDPLKEGFQTVASTPAIQLIEWEEGSSKTYVCTKYI